MMFDPKLQINFHNIVSLNLNNENLSLTQISDRMNFTSLSYLSCYVSKHLGMSIGIDRAISLKKRTGIKLF